MRRLLVANRGEIALRVFRACGSLGIETVAVVAPDDAGSLHARSADTTVAIASYLDAAEIVRAALESGRRLGASRVRLSRRERRIRGGSARRRTDMGRTAACRASGRRRQARREGDCARGRCPGAAERDAGGGRLPAAGQGGRRWRRTRHAHRPLAGRARRSARCRTARGAGRVRGRHGLLRALSRAAAPCGDPAARRRARHRRRARRARVLGAAPPPEGARGVAVDGARSRVARRDERRGDRVRARDRLRERRHGRVHAVRPRVLVPRAERADPGRASGDGARVRRRPRPRAAADRAGRASLDPGNTLQLGRTRRRGAALRRGSAHVPAAGGTARAAATAGGDPRRRRRRRGRRGRHLLRPDDREARSRTRRRGTRRSTGSPPRCARRRWTA